MEKIGQVICAMRGDILMQGASFLASSESLPLVGRVTLIDEGMELFC
jgi:hypothetical protein